MNLIQVMLGWIDIREGSEFVRYKLHEKILDPTRVCIRQLFISLVRSILEYASLIWSPYYQCHKYSLQRIQNKLVCYMYYKEQGVYDAHVSRTWLCEKYKLVKLEKRREIFNNLYLYKVVNGLIDDQMFLSRLHFNIPTYNTRAVNTFYLPSAAQNNTQLNSPLYRMCMAYNRVQHQCDIFSDSLSY